MKYLVLLTVTLLLRFSFATVTTFFGSDEGAADANSIPNSLEARDNFLAALEGCWNIRTYDYENIQIGRTQFPLDSGRTRVSLTGTISNSGIQSDESADVDALVGFPVNGNKFIRVVPRNRRGAQVQVIWDFTNDNVKAFGSFFTGVGSQPSSFSIRFRGGTTTRYPIEVSGGGAFFFGAIADRPFDRVIATLTNRANVADIFSVDQSFSAISSSVNTRRLGRFVFVSNTDGCPVVTSIDTARSYCACLGTTLADITSSDMSNSEFFQGITGARTCGQRNFWVNSWNGDNYQGAPLVLNAPSITVQSTGSNGVLCNSP